MAAIRVEEQDEGVRLAGELGTDTVPGVLKQIDGWLGADTPVIDLGGITRADSAGAALLLEIQRRARAAGRRVRFCNAPEQLQAILLFCALEQILEVE